MKDNIQNMEFHEHTKTIAPLPNKSFIFLKPEFKDIFITGTYGGKLNLGVWDNFFNPLAKHAILAYGDSFTRGVGSGDARENSWAAKLDRINPDHISIFSRGGSGVNAKDQLENYKKMKWMKHNVVMLGTIGSDILESFQGCQAPEVISQLPPQVDKQDFLRTFVLDTKNYSEPLDYMYPQNEFRSYSIYNLLRLKEAIGLKGSRPRFEEYKKHWDKICNKLLKTPKYVQEGLYHDVYKSLEGEFVEDCDQEFCFRFNTHILKKSNDRKKRLALAYYYTSFINEFKREAYKNGADFILVLFPEKRHVYSSFFKDSFVGLDPQFDLNAIKHFADKDIKIIDLRPGFTKQAVLYAKKKKLLFHRFDGHFNQAGHQVASQLLWEELVKIYPLTTPTLSMRLEQ